MSLWGLEFSNPLGVAAGFDKNAEVFDKIPDFGFVEVGTVTPRAQAGNPRPRVFRLPADQAVINRLGFNNEGVDAAAPRLLVGGASRPTGVNVGCNRDSSNRVADFVAGIERLGPFADYLAVNVSSPNTPGLRDLQGASEMEGLIGACVAARDTLPESRRPPLLVKLSPDLDEAGVEASVGAAMSGGVDGFIVSNTTRARPPELRGRHRAEVGGLSGRPLFRASTECLRIVSRLTRGSVPLIGVGGVASGADAYAKIRAGASLVQLYTALIYRGPGLVRRIEADLVTALQRDGFSHLSEAVGVESVR